MKIIVHALLLCFFISNIATAQTKQNHFIYIQSETKEPFFVMMNGDNYSSSPSGFLILAKLQNGVYNFTIGFAQDKYPEQKFSYTIADKDQGFALRLNSSKRWQLFNLQDFTTVADGDNATVSSSQEPKQIVTSTTTSSIIKASSSTTDEGLKEVYIDKLDTIAILIPKAEKSIKFNKTAKNCTIATNDDFLKTRLQMAASNTEADMLNAASLAFKDKCFSVEQVKNLSALILTEENKLSFFISAKSNVYDAQNLSSLQQQLSKKALIQQFRNAL